MSTNSAKEAASRILSHSIRANTDVDRVYSRGMFRRKVAEALNLDTEVTDSDLNIIVTFLSRDKSMIIYDHDARITSLQQLTKVNNTLSGHQIQASW